MRRRGMTSITLAPITMTIVPIVLVMALLRREMIINLNHDDNDDDDNGPKALEEGYNCEKRVLANWLESTLGSSMTWI